MSLPRQVLPDEIIFLTRRCLLRMLLLRPDDVTNQTLAYCLAEAAQRFEIDVILPLAMSNHHHTVLYDPKGNLVPFMEHFHKLVAKAINAHRRRCENLWSVEQPCVVRLADREDVIRKIVYTATNPVKAGLVSKAEHWPGFSGLEAFLSGEPIVTRRPKHFFRELGPMPETVVLELKIPPQLGDPDEFRAEVKRRIREVEEACAKKRAGRRVMGAAAVKNQPWDLIPEQRAMRLGLRPRYAAKCLWRRLEILQRDADWQRAYRVAYDAWREGEPAVFPVGTYWLARFANVAVASAKNC